MTDYGDFVSQANHCCFGAASMPECTSTETLDIIEAFNSCETAICAAPPLSSTCANTILGLIQTHILQLCPEIGKIERFVPFLNGKAGSPASLSTFVTTVENGTAC